MEREREKEKSVSYLIRGAANKTNLIGMAGHAYCVSQKIKRNEKGNSRYKMSK